MIILAFRFVSRPGCWGKRAPRQQQQVHAQSLPRLSYRSPISGFDRRHQTRRSSADSGSSIKSNKASTQEMEFAGAMGSLHNNATLSQNSPRRTTSSWGAMKSYVSRPPPAYSRWCAFPQRLYRSMLQNIFHASDVYVVLNCPIPHASCLIYSHQNYLIRSVLQQTNITCV